MTTWIIRNHTPLIILLRIFPFFVPSNFALQTVRGSRPEMERDTDAAAWFRFRNIIVNYNVGRGCVSFLFFFCFCFILLVSFLCYSQGKNTVCFVCATDDVIIFMSLLIRVQIEVLVSFSLQSTNTHSFVNEIFFAPHCLDTGLSAGNCVRVSRVVISQPSQPCLAASMENTRQFCHLCCFLLSFYFIIIISIVHFPL